MENQPEWAYADFTREDWSEIHDHLVTDWSAREGPLTRHECGTPCREVDAGRCQSGGMAEVNVTHNPNESRFEASLGGELAGTLSYVTSGTVVDLQHTVVRDAFEGKGVGGALVRGTLESLRADNLTIIPTCPFVQAYLQRHPEFQDLVDADRA